MVAILTIGIPGCGPIIGGISGGIMGAPAMGAAAMCGEGVILFCISLGPVG